MRIIEIADGVITLEMQPEEAMDIARACGSVLADDLPLTEENDHDYRLYRTTFEALAVAGNAQYSIGDSDEEAAASLSALRAVKR